MERKVELERNVERNVERNDALISFRNEERNGRVICDVSESSDLLIQVFPIDMDQS